MQYPKQSNIIRICLFSSLHLLLSCDQMAQKAEQKGEKIIEMAPPPSEPGDTTKNLETKTLNDYILTANSVLPNKKNSRPFDTLDYDKIIAYDFEGSEEPYPAVIDEKGNFVPVVLAQKALTQKQADNILSALTNKSSYGSVTAACFVPDLALVFFKGTQLKAQINICLDCNFLISSIPIPAETENRLHKGTNEEIALTGFSEEGRKAIIQLCREINFRYGAKTTYTY